jgi:hypothetical protein
VADQQTQQTAAHARRKEGLEGIGQAASLVCLVRKQFADAQAIGMHSPKIANEMASIADQNEQFAKWVDWFSISGPYAELTKAMLPLMLQLMANHGKIPAEAGSALGVVSPTMLEMAGKAEQKKIEAALILQIQETERETAELQKQVQANES